MSYAARYLYLGAFFTDITKVDDVLNLHKIASEAVVNKFYIFCAANTQMPFLYKSNFLMLQ